MSVAPLMQKKYALIKPSLLLDSLVDVISHRANDKRVNEAVKYAGTDRCSFRLLSTDTNEIATLKGLIWEMEVMNWIPLQLDTRLDCLYTIDRMGRAWVAVICTLTEGTMMARLTSPSPSSCDKCGIQ